MSPLVRFAAITLSPLLLLGAECGKQATTPSASDVATTAVVLTDDALAVAIAVAPSPYDEATWGDRVRWVKAAAEAVEASQSLCPHIAGLVAVADGVGCAKCSEAIAEAKEQLKCQ